MQEKIKIITDGISAEVYVDGKKVKCTDIDLEFHGHVGEEPTITCNATWFKENSNGSVIVLNNHVMTEGIHFNNQYAN